MFRRCVTKNVISLTMLATGMMLAGMAPAATPNPPKQVCIGNTCVTSPTGGGKIKWNPGHYMASQSMYKQGMSLGDFQGEMDALTGYDNIIGYRLTVTWGALEPNEGQYDFSVLDAVLNRLKTHYNQPKHLVISLVPGSFANSLHNNSDGSCIPKYILNDSKYGPSPWPGAYGWWGSDRYYVATLYRPAVQARFKALLAAIAAHYDNEPNFEALIVQEDSWMVGAWKGSPDFDWNGTAPFPDIMAYAVSVFPHTNIALENSYLLREPATYELANWMTANRVLPAGADTPGQTAYDNYGFSLSWGHLAYTGVAGPKGSPAVVDSRPKAHMMMDVEGPDICTTTFAKYGGPYTPADIIVALNKTYQASHAFWTHVNNKAPNCPSTSFWQNLAPVVNSSVLTNTSYPAIYPQ